jgi:hypothetical protein
MRRLSGSENAYARPADYPILSSGRVNISRTCAPVDSAAGLGRMPDSRHSAPHSKRNAPPLFTALY